jgi:hypothetical protein
MPCHDGRHAMIAANVSDPVHFEESTVFTQLVCMQQPFGMDAAHWV